ncbi:hypothetical protein K4E_25680 [Enterococcus thailandicus]|nr:hypothetical protein K4E_25680 [Enterococcus thailandicus]
MSYEVKSLNEECGIFGVWGHQDAASVTYFGLHSLQHRGQEGAGIVSNDEGKLHGQANSCFTLSLIPTFALPTIICCMFESCPATYA